MGIVNLHGQSVSELQVKGSSLVKSKQWLEFLEAWGPTFAESEPWARLLLNGTLALHQSFVIFSRRLRKNRAFTGGGTMAEDSAKLAEFAAERLAWFETASEQVDQRGLPDWAKFLFVSLQGSLRMQVRLGSEIDQITRKGHLLLAVDRRGELAETLAEDRPDVAGAERE